MKLESSRNPTLRSSLLLGTILAIFAADLLAPLGTAVWALYTIPLLLSAKFPNRRFPLACAGLCTTLIVLGFYLSTPSQAPLQSEMFNRLAGILILWIMALILSHSRRLGSALAIRTDELKTKASLLNEAHDAILVRDLEDRILYWNRGAGERYGWFEREAIGRRAHELLKTQFPEPLHRILEQTLSHGTWEGEVTHTTRDGRQLYVASRWTVQRDATGQAQAILEINTDITNLMETQELWRGATAQMAAIFNSSPLPILVMDPGGHILRWSASAERVFGWTEQEVIGKVCPTVPQSGLDDFHRMIRQAIQEGALHSLVRHRRKKDGTVVDTNISVSALPGRNGHALGVVAILEDITDRTRAKDELAASERRLRAILEAEPEYVMVTSTDGNLLYMNPAGLAMIEAEGSKQVIGRPVSPLIAPAYRDAFVKFNDRVIDGAPGRMQFEIVGLKGRRLWMDTHSIPLRDEENVTIGVLSITRDITEQKRNEEVVRRYETIFRRADWGMVIADLETHQLLQVNPAFARMHGYTVEEMEGMNLADTFVPEARAEVARHTRAAHEKGHHVYEVLHLRKDGSRFPCRTEVTSYRDATGRVVFRAGIFEDLTERKQAEEALRESEARFRTFMDHSPAAAWIKDAQGRYTYANKLFETALGLPSSKWLGATDDQLWAPEEAKQLRDNDETVLTTGKAVEAIESVVHPDGLLHQWWVFKFPVQDANNARYVAGMAVDVTERKRAEEALRTSEQSLRLLIEERERLMRDLHDGLIQSLYAIGLSLEECKRLTHEDLKKTQAKLGQTVDDINRVIREVRHHLVQGQDDLPFSAHRLKTELARVAATMERANALHFRLTVEQRAAECLTSEERKEILYITQEAMSNCLRHSGAKIANVSLRLGRDRVCLEVEDDGKGFETTILLESNGGLRNIERRAEKVGASVEIVSRRDYGTRIRLSVPIHA